MHTLNLETCTRLCLTNSKINFAMASNLKLIFIQNLRKSQIFQKSKHAHGQKVLKLNNLKDSKISFFKGNYVINNYLPDLSKLPTAILKSGDYMGECKILDKDEKFLAGVQTFGQLIYVAG